MNPRIRRLLGELFAFSPSVDGELVATANGIAALLIGVLLWWKLELSLAWAITCVVLAFVGLTALLLSRNTYWIAALTGGLVLSVAPACLLAGGGLALGSNILAWAGGVLGFLGGFGVAFFGYRDLARKVGGDGEGRGGRR